MKWASAGVLFIVFGAIVFASESFQNGFVNDDGYVWHDGYWTWDGKQYTRRQEYYTTQRAYSNGYGGYYYQPYQTYRWRYYLYTPPAPVAQVAALPKPNDPLWRSKLLELARQRDQVEGAMRLEALENANYLESLRELGLSGNFMWQNYGQSLQYPSASSIYGKTTNYQYGRFGNNGSTIYGSSEITMADIYGSTDLNVLFQQADKHVQNAQQLAGQGASDFMANVQAVGTNAGRVAEIYAKAKAAGYVLGAVEGNSAKVTQQTTTFGTQPNIPPIMPKAAPEPPPGPIGGFGGPSAQEVEFQKAKIQARGRFFDKNCFVCDTAKDPQTGKPRVPAGKMDLTQYERFPLDRKQLVWDRMTTQDDALRMPRLADGSPGPIMDREELQHLFP